MHPANTHLASTQLIARHAPLLDDVSAAYIAWDGNLFCPSHLTWLQLAEAITIIGPGPAWLPRGSEIIAPPEETMKPSLVSLSLWHAQLLRTARFAALVSILVPRGGTA